MHRFYLSPELCGSPVLELTGREAHHARDVLRLDRKDQVFVVDGKGREFLCQVRNLDRHGLTVEVLESKTFPRPSSCITLIQAVPKGKLIESIIQKAVELGVARVVPLLSERVALRLESDADTEAKTEKWRQIAIEAIKQCGQPWLPEISEPKTLPYVVDETPRPELALVGSLEAGSRHPRHYFQEFETSHKRLPQTVTAWIGPEGDFTAEELFQIRKSGAHPITLGPLVLRSDTAALYTISILSYELQRDAQR